MKDILNFFLFGIIGIIFSSCSNYYEQDYKTYTEFDKVNQRNKGWFPTIISPDTYNFRNYSYLDSFCAFGTFSYTKDNYYDSIFENPKNNQRDSSIFIKKFNRNIKLKPNWFLDIKTLKKKKFEFIQKENFHIAREKNNKIIYFILSN